MDSAGWAGVARLPNHLGGQLARAVAEQMARTRLQNATADGKRSFNTFGPFNLPMYKGDLSAGVSAARCRLVQQARCSAAGNHKRTLTAEPWQVARIASNK
jgi:hypothetical protein